MKEVDWPAPCGYTVFCDDIRQEINGKHTLVGCYQGVMFVNREFPVILPRFAMRVVYTERSDADIPDLKLNVFFPGDDDDNPAFSMDISIPKERPGPIGDPGPYPRASLTSPIVLDGVEIKERGRIRVRMYRGDEIIKLGALTIEKNPTMETEQPS